MSIITTLRELYPHYDKYSDEELLSVFKDDSPSVTTDITPPDDEPGIVSDLTSSFGVGSNTLLKGIGAIYGWATDDMDNLFVRQGQSGIDYWQSRKSSTLTDLEEQRSQAIGEADGFWSEMGTAIWETVSNPRLLASTMAETTPSLVTGAVGGRVASAGAGLAGASKAGQVSAYMAGNLGSQSALQGASVGEEVYSNLKQITEANPEFWTLNPDFVALSQEMEPEAAIEQLTLKYSKEAALAAAGLSIASNVVPGGRAIEKALGGKGSGLTGSAIGRTTKGLLGESVQEGFEEGSGQLTGNLYTARVDQDQDPLEGVGSAAGIGMAAGGPLGAITGLTSGERPPISISNEGSRQAAYMARMDASNAAARERDRIVYEADQEAAAAIRNLSTPVYESNPLDPNALSNDQLSRVVSGITAEQAQRETTLSGGGLSDPSLRRNYIEDMRRLEQLRAESDRRGLLGTIGNGDVNNITPTVNNITPPTQPVTAPPAPARPQVQIPETPVQQPVQVPERPVNTQFTNYPNETLSKVIGTVSWNNSEMERQLRRNDPGMDRPRVQAEYQKGVAELEALTAEADRRGISYELRQSYGAEKQAREPVQAPGIETPVTPPTTQVEPVARPEPAEPPAQVKLDIPENPNETSFKRLLTLFDDQRKGADLDQIATAVGLPKKRQGETNDVRTERLREAVTMLDRLSQYDADTLKKSFTVPQMESMLDTVGSVLGGGKSPAGVAGKAGVAERLVDTVQFAQDKFDLTAEAGRIRTELKELAQAQQPIPVDRARALQRVDGLRSGADFNEAQGTFYSTGDLDVAVMLGHTELKPVGQRENEEIYQLAERFADDPLEVINEMGKQDSPEFNTFVERAQTVTQEDFAEQELSTEWDALGLGLPRSFAGDLWSEIKSDEYTQWKTQNQAAIDAIPDGLVGETRTPGQIYKMPSGRNTLKFNADNPDSWLSENVYIEAIKRKDTETQDWIKDYPIREMTPEVRNQLEMYLFDDGQWQDYQQKVEAAKQAKPDTLLGATAEDTANNIIEAGVDWSSLSKYSRDELRSIAKQIGVKLANNETQVNSAIKILNGVKPTAEALAAAKPKSKVQVTKNTVFTDEAAQEALQLLLKKRGQLNSGIDPEVFKAGITLAGHTIERGVRTFAAYAKAMVEMLGTDYNAYLKQWYIGVKMDPSAAAFKDEMDSLESVEAADIDEALSGDEQVTEIPQDGGTEVTVEKAADPTPENETPVESDVYDVAMLNAIKDNMAEITSNNKLKKVIADQKGIKPSEVDANMVKEGQEIYEYLLAFYARKQDQAASGGITFLKPFFDNLVTEYNQQPNLNVRTSTSMANQAYSTPRPMAWVAQRLAGVNASTDVYEPTAGMGMLTTKAQPANILANELNDLRAELLRRDLPQVTQNDATTYVPAGKFDVVITNPPFGPLKGGAVKVDGYTIKKLDHLIAANALKAMKDDGRAVLIIGANKEAGEIGSGADRVFFNWLYSHYNVVDHFEVSGDLYARQGAGWPVRMITIQGRQKSDKIGPQSGTIDRLNSWEELYERHTQTLDAIKSGTSSETGTDGASRPEANESNESGGQNDQQDSAPDREVTEPGLSDESTGRDSRDDGERSSGSSVPDSNVGDTERSDGAGRPESETSETTGRGEGVQRTDTGDVGGRSDKQSGRVSEASGSDFQTNYTTLSGGPNDKVLTPAGMGEASLSALNNIQEAVGNIDQYVQQKLGYESVEDMYEMYMGLQIDTIAAAIYNYEERDRGIIIADQTGVGKGRQAAGILRYAKRIGKIPIFVTVKPNLFTDMYEELQATGSDPSPLIINTDGVIKDGDQVVVRNTAGKHKKALQKIVETGQLPEGTDMVFLTYSQLNVENLQRDVIRALKDKAFFVLDESHNVAGERVRITKKKGKTTTGAGFMFQMLEDTPVTYLSATYAKRPDNMPVYFRTDISMAVDSLEELVDAVKNGGEPLQTALASMLSESGQLWRRERSFEGIEIKNHTITEGTEEQEKFSDQVTEGLRSIVSADKIFHTVQLEHANEAANAAGALFTGGAGNKASNSVDHHNFSSVAHNFINQLLLGVKVKATADLAIEAHKRGEKPVIALEHTMGSFLQQYVDETGAKIGDVIDLSYKDVLKRALERSRRLKYKDANGDEEVYQVPMDELLPEVREYYEQAEDIIDSLEIDELPVSPIDYLRNRLEEAEISVAEVTGRSYIIDYSSGTPVLAKRDTKEIKDRRGTIDGFNKGTINALILNSAGATGLSIHASERFDDKHPRHMLVAQPMADINILMQMLGRINRTGQVTLPIYTMLGANIPAEKRPLARTAMKLKSLNANTSANTESDTSVKVADILNKYGDRVVRDYLIENPDLADKTNLKVNSSEDDNGEGESIAGLATKFTGRLALLSVEEQKSAYDDIEAAYNQLIDYLDKVGQNDLNPTTLELDAKIKESAIVYEGKAPDTIFGGHTFLHKIDSKYQGKPPTAEEARELIAKAEDPDKTITDIIDAKESDLDYAQQLDDTIRKRQDAVDDLLAQEPDSDDPSVKAKWSEKVGKARSALDKAKEATGQYDRLRSLNKQMVRTFKIGSHIRMDLGGETVTGIITSVKNTHKSGRGNPWALSKVRVGFVVNNGIRTIELPFTQLTQDKGIFIERLRNEGDTGLDDVFNLSTRMGDRRETRYIATGNLIAGSASLEKGRIVNFTDSEGKVHKGIFMPHNFKSGQFQAIRDNGSFPMRDLALVAKYLRTYHDRATVTSPNRAIHVTAGRRPNTWSISVPKANKDALAKAVKYDKDLMDAMGTEFAGSGARMAATFDDNRLDEVLEVLTRTVPLVGDKQQRKMWVDIGGDAAPEQVDGFDNGDVDLDGAKLSAKEGTAEPEAQTVKPRQLSDVMQQAADIAEMFGKKVRWVKSKTIDGAAKDGEIYINASSGVPNQIVLGHELTHTLKTEAPELYAYLEALIVQNAKLIPADTEEFVANVVGNRFGEKQFWLDMAGADSNSFKQLARRVMAFLKDVMSRLRGDQKYADGNAVRNIGKIRNEVAKAMAAYGSRNQGMTVQQFQQTYAPQQFTRTPDQQAVDLDGAFGIPTQTMTAKILTTFQDKFLILKQIQNNIKKAGGKITDESDFYGSETLFHGETEEDLREMRDEHVRPLVEAMAKAGITKEELDDFLYARHAGERNAAIAEINEDFPDGGSGMTDADAQKILDKVADSGKQKEYEALADRVYAMLKWKRDILAESGLAGEKQMESWEEKFDYYVPLKGSLYEAPSPMRTGQGFSISRKNESQRAMGRATRADSPLAMSMQDLTETIIRAQKNKVGNAFLKLVQDNPYEGYWEVFTEDHPDIRRVIKAFTETNPVTGEAETMEYVDWAKVNMSMMANNYFVTKKNGKRYFIKLEDERVMEALKLVGVEQVNHLTRWMGNVTRFMSSMNTAYNPEFMIANFVSDVQTALMNLQAEQDGADGRVVGQKVTKAAAKGIWPAGKAYWRAVNNVEGKTAEDKKWDEYARRFLRSGGKTGYFDMKDLEGQIRELDTEFEIATGTTKGKLLKRKQQIGGLVENINGSIENAVRLSAFVAATQEAKLSDKQAAILAKDMTVNFNRRGTSGTLLNSLFMFANASIQGTANFARTLGMLKPALEENDPIYKRLTNAQKIAAAMVMGSVILAMWNREMAGEDDDGENWYDKVPGYEKERNIIIMKPGTNGEYWKIRLPYGYNIFSVLGTTFEAMTNGNRPIAEQMGRLLGATAMSFSPTGFETSNDAIGFVAKNITPTIGRPLVDLALNENFFGSTIYTDNLPFGTPKPDSSLSRPPKGLFDEGVKGAVSWLNSITGGSKFRSGALDFNGDALAYVLKYPFGAAGKFWGEKVPDFTERVASGREVPIRKVPFVSRVSGEVLPYEDTDNFYRRRDEINQYRAEYKSLKGSEKLAFLKENRSILRLDDDVKRAEKKLKDLRKKRRAIYDDKSLSGVDRDKRLKLVEDQMKRIIDRFNKAYNEAQ